MLGAPFSAAGQRSGAITGREVAGSKIAPPRKAMGLPVVVRRDTAKVAG